ncbi:sensor domain-containing protein [Halorhabdus amylolytica]|uniref:sensor domain-containing protein n=1 Tax=Halorhabdus amylolytica TaxID=2559573 RepID=UPI0020BDA9D0|nr:sensor domain-containing protein [Halorhabdus amylolytica]
MTPAKSADGGPERGEDDDPETNVDDDPSLAELREQVETEYDFENFGPEDMAEMEPREWEAAFDPETWITGNRLLDRLEADLRQRVADRDVFARIDREDDRLVAYSDSSYAVVHPDGTVEGEGTVLRDVKPSVALCSMESYEVPDPPEGDLLPDPEDVSEGDGEVGNIVVQALSFVQLLAGLVLVGYAVVVGGAIALVAGLALLGIGLFLLVLVANARLSDAYRAEEYRRRLREMGVDDDRPAFVPDLGESLTADAADAVEPADPEERIDTDGSTLSNPD